MRRVRFREAANRAAMLTYLFRNLHENQKSKKIRFLILTTSGLPAFKFGYAAVTLRSGQQVSFFQRKKDRLLNI